MEGYFLEMRGITKRFGDLVANDSIDLAIKEGEILALLGENGAGKTTLMNILYGMYEMDSGEILVRGRRVNIRSPHDAASLGIGMVHQRFMLIPDFTVVENVALGLRQEGDLGPMLHLGPVAKKIESISRQHGLAVNPTAKVDNLSMGARQRVEIIKLLVRDARLLVLDEPTAVLTPGEVGTLFTFLRSLTCQGHAIIFITHKMNEVMELSDRVTVLRDGKVIGTKRTAETNPEELARMM
ncbi:MAG TPA: ATP-binding cassette domain-containing protein, partial [Firmicutes bacterium]|nr:ATP-binding cassette domain-containing protein [Bacillota bacterium]